MSKFNNYARRLDEMAKAAFTEYRKAESKYKEAETKARETSRYKNSVNPEYVARATRAQADYISAKEAFRQAKNAFTDSTNQFNTIRNELEAAVGEAFSANPSQIDNNTIILIESGILTSGEYSRLIKEAKANGNPTMVRVLGAAAEKAAKEYGERYGRNDPEAVALRLASHESKAYTGGDRVSAFDELISVYHRCTRNPSMIEQWDRIVSEAIENF